MENNYKTSNNHFFRLIAILGLAVFFVSLGFPIAASLSSQAVPKLIGYLDLFFSALFVGAAIIIFVLGKNNITEKIKKASLSFYQASSYIIILLVAIFRVLPPCWNKDTIVLDTINPLFYDCPT